VSPNLPPRAPADAERTQWKERALALDNYLRYSDWKRSSPNAYYDSALIRRVQRSLKELREKDDVEGVRAVLEVALRSNFAGVESFRLYSETFYGTKELIENYVEEGKSCLPQARGSMVADLPVLKWRDLSLIYVKLRHLRCRWKRKLASSATLPKTWVPLPCV
jgi:hypothetical protein